MKLHSVIRSFNNSEFDVARKYISIICVLNSIHLAPKELDLLAFTAVNRDISSGGKKEEFVKQFDSSIQTVSNMIFRLKKLGLLQTVERKTKLNPNIRVEPSLTFTIELNGYDTNKGESS